VLELRSVVAVDVDHEVAVPLAFGEDAGEEWCGAWGEGVVLGAVRHMYCPERDELPKAKRVNDTVVPKPYGEDAGIVSELDPEEALSCFVLLAGFGDIVKVHDAAHELDRN
jgi:hypothetical protein